MSANPKPPVTIAYRRLNVPAETQRLGVRDDRHSEQVEFVMPQSYAGIDLSTKALFVDTMNAKGEIFDTASPLVTLENDTLRLLWRVGPVPVSSDGKVSVRLRAIGENYVWQTETAEFFVATTFDTMEAPETPEMSYFNQVQLACVEAHAGTLRALDEASDALADIRAIKTQVALDGGLKGDPGEAATLAIVQTVTGPSGGQASAIETQDSTAQARKYVVTIPAGRDGATGAQGAIGPPSNIDAVTGGPCAAYADGASVSIRPAPGSTVTVKCSAAGTLTVNGTGQAVTAGQAVSFAAASASCALSVSAGTMAVRYNRDVLALIDALTTPASATGAVAQVYPVEGLPLGVTARMIATQAGTGDPSPSNVRAITGYTTLHVTQSATGYEPHHNSTYPVTLPETLYGLKDYPVVYDALAGTIKASDVYTAFAGTEGWVLSSSTGAGGVPLFIVALTDAPLFGANNMSNAMMCNLYKVINPVGNATTQLASGQCILRTNSGGNGTNLYVAANYATLNDFKAFLAAQNAAGKPLTILRPTTAVRTLTVPSLIIPALPGLNNVCTDGGGDTTVTCRESPAHLQARVAALEAHVAGI